MTDQENKNNSFFLDALSRLLKVAKNYNLDLSSDNFKNNLKEILNNPNSKYAEHVCLFNEIPKLIKQKENLNNEIQSLNTQIEELKTAKTNLETEKSEKENEIEDLKSDIKEFEKIKKNLELEINGSDDPNDNEEKKFGLKKIRNDLYEKIYGTLEFNYTYKDVDDYYYQVLEDNANNLTNVLQEVNYNKDLIKSKVKQKGLLRILKNLNDGIIEKTKENSICTTLSELKGEAIKNNRCYYVYIFLMILLIGLSSKFAYLYGDKIIEDITKIANKDSRDYFGMFLMKIPFSLMIITFISCGFIFINKLLVIIERINNQLRNISQISVIASQIDKKAFDLNHKKTEEELKNAVEKKEESALFYNLIADYLINLSKNELELKEKKGNQLKMLKELSGIINKINPKP
jgi:hypothetical protein